MDIEGNEITALRGTRSLLSQAHHPILLRVHPVALGETGVNPKCFLVVIWLCDPQDPSLPFGSRIFDLSRINWICNLFAVPTGKENAGNGRSAVIFARNEFGIDRRGA
jgi:hypothetical protein